MPEIHLHGFQDPDEIRKGITNTILRSDPKLAEEVVIVVNNDRVYRCVAGMPSEAPYIQVCATSGKEVTQLIKILKLDPNCPDLVAGPQLHGFFKQYRKLDAEWSLVF